MLASLMLASLRLASPGLAQEAAVPQAVPVPVEAVPPSSSPSPSPSPSAGAAADAIADVFSKVGDQIYEDCIFELSEEQVAIQAGLILSYIERGATSQVARRLAATQIQPPKLPEQCEQMRRTPEEPAPDWSTTTVQVPKKPAIVAQPKAAPEPPQPPISLTGKAMLARWDCAPGVDYVTVHLKGYQRKLTGGEICSPFEDVVREVPASAGTFRLGYTIATGRLFVISDNPSVNGMTIAWGLSGRDVCRNNPDPDCFAAKAVGPLPPGEYIFSSAEPSQRVTWGPRTKRHVVGIYLKTLWEACSGLDPKGWASGAQLIKDGRATAPTAYTDEPHPQIAEAPPVIVASSFSLTSLFK